MQSFKSYFLETVTHPKCGTCVKNSCVGCPIFERDEINVFSGELSYEKIKDAIDLGKGNFKISTFPLNNKQHMFIWVGAKNQKEVERWLQRNASMGASLSSTFDFDSKTNTLKSENESDNALIRGIQQAIKNRLSSILGRKINLEKS